MRVGKIEANKIHQKVDKKVDHILDLNFNPFKTGLSEILETAAYNNRILLQEPLTKTNKIRTIMHISLKIS